ncbi:ribose 5-phosphate isomerase B [Mycoplasma sp. P36-A1]|uniref:ribose 5-phosphate isomerase B n=1 Tax=Mycoplasma sp. P36-A1 TaxID=3252900 RepID=UPI003C2AB774
MKKLVIGSDHGGFEYKEVLKQYLLEHGYEVMDVGTHTSESVDYPDIAKAAADVVLLEGIPGILICGTGIGISIAANKVKGIRAALCHDTFSAKMSRRHNNANMIAFGQRVIGQGLMIEIINAWLNETFEGDRHERRVNKMMNLEEK